MRKVPLTPSQLNANLLRQDWEREQTFTLMLEDDAFSRPRKPAIKTVTGFYFEKEEQVYIPRVCGSVTKISTLGGVRLLCHQKIQGFLYQPDSIEIVGNKYWTIEGISVVDDEGFRFTEEEFQHIAKNFPLAFSDINLTPIREEVTVVQDLDEGEDHQKLPNNIYFLESKDCPSICFTGKHLAEVESSGDPNDLDNYSGKENHWTRLELYKPDVGGYVGRKEAFLTLDKNFHDLPYIGDGLRLLRSEIRVLHNKEAVKHFFGEHWLAQQLIAQWKKREQGEQNIASALKQIRKMVEDNQKKSND